MPTIDLTKCLALTGITLGLFPVNTLASADPQRSQIESYAAVGLSVVEEDDSLDLFDDQGPTLDPLGTLVSTAAINSSQGFYTSTTSTGATFTDSDHGSFSASASYMGNRAPGDIDAQTLSTTIRGGFEYDFTIPAEGILDISGTVINPGPSPIQFYALVQVFAEFMPGTGFAGSFFEQQIIDAGADGEAFNLSIPLVASSSSYRMRIRLLHSSVGSLDVGPLASSLSASWSIDAPGVCIADLNDDGELDFLDISEFLTAFAAQSPIADLNGDGEFDFLDISAFLKSYSSGCP